MQLHVGDRFTDEEGEWEIVTRPWTTNAGKLVHAAIQQPGDPSKNATRPGAHMSGWRLGRHEAVRGPLRLFPEHPVRRRARRRRRWRLRHPTRNNAPYSSPWLWRVAPTPGNQMDVGVHDGLSRRLATVGADVEPLNRWIIYENLGS